MSLNGSNCVALEAGEGPSSSARVLRTYGRTSSTRQNGVNGSKSWRYRDPPKEENVVVTQEMLEAGRTALLAEKQASLEGVYDRHDDLVREVFHMENYRMMVGYNPQDAKQDDTNVFKEYKSRYDLLEKVAPTTTSTRQTRRAHTERRQLLSTSSISAPVIGSSISSPKVKDRRKPKPKAPDTSAIWDILASARDKTKGKGKEKVVEKDAEAENTLPAFAEIETVPVPESISVIYSRPRKVPKEKEPPSTKPVSEKPVTSSENVTPKNVRIKHPVEESISVGIARRSGRLKETILADPSPRTTRADSHKVLQTRLLPHVKDRPTQELRQPRELRPQKELHATKESRPLKELRRRKEAVVVSAPPAVPKFNVKRIKLIVRRPPPTISNPRQRAPPPKYNESLGSFLSSFVSLRDQDTDAATVQQESAADAAVLERVEQFRKQGRFIPGTDVLFGTKPDSITYVSPTRVSTDPWDAVVEAIEARGKHKSSRISGRLVAAQVASKIEVYWEKKSAMKDKAKVQEERRLRKLAEATMKMVTEEWKKAVFHIREKERLKYEAEERRRGHEHLDAILDQSGQILQTQQGDLTRGDLYAKSRSSSISEHIRGWGSEADEQDEDEEDDEDNEVAEREEGEEAEQGRDAEEDADSGFVDGSRHGQQESDGDEEDEDEDGAILLLGGGAPTVQTPVRRELDTSISMAYSQDSLDERSLIEDLTAGQPSDNMELDDSSDIAVHDLITGSFDSSPARPYSLLPLVDYDMTESTSSRSSIYLDDERDISFEDSIAGTETPMDITTSLPPSDISGARDTDLPDSSFILESDMDGPSPELLHVLKLGASELGVKQDHIIVADSQDDLPDTSVPDISMADLQQEMPEEDGIQEEKTQLEDADIPGYLKPYAVVHVDYDPDAKVIPPLLLRGVLRPYQQSGLEWLASLHTNNWNGILADEMGLGKTIQTISLLAHLACDRGIWGPHLIIVPTSVLLNWEMEFKKFLPGFKILSYHGSTKRRKELRQGWNDKYHFNVCITSYTLASRDAHIFKRKAWYYMILDEAHMIKNFKSQRWNILLNFRSFRRLLLTGTPLQNNLTELWALLQFLLSGSNFANLREFAEWFSNPVEKAIEMGQALDEENLKRVSKLHQVLRPYLLRRLKRDVEKELPHKYEHLVLCPLSKRQRFLYDEFMSRAATRDDLDSGVYQKIANILMQLRKVCNHPDLFEVRPIVTSFAMQRSAIVDFEIQELLVRKRLLEEEDERVNLDLLGLRFVESQETSLISSLETKRLDATSYLPYISEVPGEPPPKDTSTVAGFRAYSAYQQRASKIARWIHTGYLNRLRCNRLPIYSRECIETVRQLSKPILPMSAVDTKIDHLRTVYRTNLAVKSYAERADIMAPILDRFAFVTPLVVALDMPRIALAGYETKVLNQPPEFDDILHRASVKLQIAFPDPSLLQYDCGKLQELTRLLRERKSGGHRILIFTQMTKILDILEIFLNFHGYLYLRLDGATKIEDRQYITERFNADPRIFCFIASSRSGGVGINLTGADTVVFYDSDFNPQMDRQCEDRAHRIGQIRDVHIYRFVSQHTVEESMLRKANQKRSLDDLVIQRGEFDWRSLFNDEGALTKALGEVEDTEDAHAATVAAREEIAMEGADEADFAGDAAAAPATEAAVPEATLNDDSLTRVDGAGTNVEPQVEAEEEDEEEDGGTIVDYLITFVERDYDCFREWRL